MSRRRNATPRGFQSLDDVHESILASRSDIKTLWDKTEERRKVSEFLLKMRYRAGLTQSQVAKAAGWDKGFVSRLENVPSRFPDLQTISRYMTACGLSLGVIAMESPGADGAAIVEMLSLGAANQRQPLSEGEPNARAFLKSKG
jgi:transcriptional regulator with XRE-family HTH domain